MKLRFTNVASPLGTIQLVAGKDGLCSLEFGDRQGESRRRLEMRFGEIEWIDDRSLSGLVDRLERYLAGDLHALDGVPVDPGGTDFQRKVWAALRRIPPGETTSYGRLARRLGSPGAARAVGSANGRNPIAIVIPCHRVIASDGSLGGYAGGIQRKRWLLDHEGAKVTLL